MSEYTSKGQGALNTVLGAIGTAGATGILNGNMGGLFGGCGNNCGDNAYVNRYEMSMQRDIANKDLEIAYLRGRDAAKTDTLETYKYIDGRCRAIEAQQAQQAVVNAQVAANISCMQGNIATLMALTKTVVPIDNVCPAPMPQYNSWTAPT